MQTAANSDTGVHDGIPVVTFGPELHPTDWKSTMPMYEYRCRKCGERFEMLRRMADADDGLACPECRSDEVDRLLSAFSSGGCGSSGSGRFT